MNKHGQTLVTFVILLPVIFLLIGYIIEISIIGYHKSKINSVTKSIIANCIDILEDAIEKGGTTIKSFTSSEGVHGLFQNELLVHGKEGCKCINCGNTVLKTRVGGRGTYYCPVCQK